MFEFEMEAEKKREDEGAEVGGGGEGPGQATVKMEQEEQQGEAGAEAQSGKEALLEAISKHEEDEKCEFLAALGRVGYRGQKDYKSVVRAVMTSNFPPVRGPAKQGIVEQVEHEVRQIWFFSSKSVHSTHFAEHLPNRFRTICLCPSFSDWCEH